ncbi:Uncharacterised protein [Chryseobacterium indoltheticum]|uniref:Uncharacterized protein n=1 Tax=Chryseobacterium indoltheticum TaxID=254 RepID=A0A381FPE1_9FLAO|nr:Uncharacterised protein [Chryseobacterium indoltheticum]
MFNFNSYSKLRYWLRERIILWGLGCLRVIESERWNDLVLESSRVLGLESCMGGFGLGKGQGV